MDLEDFKPDELSKCRLGIFLMATYGEGDATDNAANFNNWMKNEKKEVSNIFLQGVSFTVFGLGNHPY